MAQLIPQYEVGEAKALTVENPARPPFGLAIAAAQFAGVPVIADRQFSRAERESVANYLGTGSGPAANSFCSARAVTIPGSLKSAWKQTYGAQGALLSWKIIDRNNVPGGDEVSVRPARCPHGRARA